MNILVHHVTQAIIHQPMTIDAALFFEPFGYDKKLVMAAAGRSAGVPGMQCRFVFKLTGLWCESFNKAGADLVDASVHTVFIAVP